MIVEPKTHVNTADLLPNPPLPLVWQSEFQENIRQNTLGFQQSSGVQASLGENAYIFSFSHFVIFLPQRVLLADLFSSANQERWQGGSIC